DLVSQVTASFDLSCSPQKSAPACGSAATPHGPSTSHSVDRAPRLCSIFWIFINHPETVWREKLEAKGRVLEFVMRKTMFAAAALAAISVGQASAADALGTT